MKPSIFEILDVSVESIVLEGGSIKTNKSIHPDHKTWKIIFMHSVVLFHYRKSLFSLSLLFSKLKESAMMASNYFHNFLIDTILLE